MTATPTRRGIMLHLRDLRIYDNGPLCEAYTLCHQVMSVVIIDVEQLNANAFGFPRWSARRVEWYLAAIRDLRQSYRDRGAELVVRCGSPLDELEPLIREFGATDIFAQAAKTSEELSLLAAIERRFDHVDCHWIWNDMLLEPALLPLSSAAPPRSFSSFRKKVEKRCTVPSPRGVPSAFHEHAVVQGCIPTITDLGFVSQPMDVRSPIATLAPGETGAWQQIDTYFWQKDCLVNYKHTRNGMMDWTDSSKLSVYLALGLISPRVIYHEILRYERERISNTSTYWLRFELLWREFFHGVAHAYGTRLFKRTGLQNRVMPWSTNMDIFQRWTNGETGVPIVDAAMTELALTGYSSNRARQISASYLVHYLGIDWRLGASWFEQHLLDYDACSNWGNWQYIAGVGTDKRDRVMSMRWQADRYDKNAGFVKRWIPEYRQESAECLSRRHPNEPS